MLSPAPSQRPGVRIHFTSQPCGCGDPACTCLGGPGGHPSPSVPLPCSSSGAGESALSNPISVCVALDSHPLSGHWPRLQPRCLPPGWWSPSPHVPRPIRRLPALQQPFPKASSLVLCFYTGQSPAAPLEQAWGQALSLPSSGGHGPCDPFCRQPTHSLCPCPPRIHPQPTAPAWRSEQAPARILSLITRGRGLTTPQVLALRVPKLGSPSWSGLALPTPCPPLALASLALPAQAPSPAQRSRLRPGSLHWAPSPPCPGSASYQFTGRTRPFPGKPSHRGRWKGRHRCGVSWGPGKVACSLRVT